MNFYCIADSSNPTLLIAEKNWAKVCEDGINLWFIDCK